MESTSCPIPAKAGIHGGTSTLADPAVVDDLIENRR